jgi:hypothetical protein
MDEFGLKKMKEQLYIQLDKARAKFNEGLMNERNYNNEVDRIERLLEDIDKYL